MVSPPSQTMAVLYSSVLVSLLVLLTVLQSPMFSATVGGAKPNDRLATG